MEGTIENKVAKSGLITIDMEEWLSGAKILDYDIAQNLWQGLALKEKDFRDFIRDHDWSAYKGTFVRVHCSEDAVVPTWAYMLLASALAPHAEVVFFGTQEEAELEFLRRRIGGLADADFEGSRVVIKGCSNRMISTQAYLELVNKLQPLVKSMMFGEPCSTVPLYKKK